MKLLTIILLTTMLSSNLLFSNNIVTGEVILDENEVIVSINNGEKSYFPIIDYNHESENIEFVTLETVNILQIFDDNDNMIYQIPVYSKDVEISKSLLEKGSYYFVFLNEKSISKSTTVEIK